MRLSNLRVISNASKAVKKNAYLKIFTLESSNKKVYNSMPIQNVVITRPNHFTTQNTKKLNLRIR